VSCISRIRSRRYDATGQTLVALLIFMMLIITVTAAAAVITVTNIRANNGYANGEQSLMYAESGVENAIQQLQRDPAYTGETIAFPNGTATISVNGTSVKTITSLGTSDNHYRTVTSTVTDVDGVIHRSSWSETP
jgi:type II secretory pathway pseudopilin PulG